MVPVPPVGLFCSFWPVTAAVLVGAWQTNVVGTSLVSTLVSHALLPATLICC